MLPSYDPNDSEAGMKLLEDLTSNAYQIQQQEKVPDLNYEDVKPYIERIANGEPSHIISSHKITELLTSSGTSRGQPKMMPSTAEDLDRKAFFYNLLACLIELPVLKPDRVSWTKLFPLLRASENGKLFEGRLGHRQRHLQWRHSAPNINHYAKREKVQKAEKGRKIGDTSFTALDGIKMRKGKKQKNDSGGEMLNAQIGNGMEIGANTCIDGGSWRDTVIGDHSKIDNLVQIGHNVVLGKSCMLCGQVGTWHG
ncbi:hypothetical protein FNV43_RR06622 [Rhamnella rubrinervis]|uniref:Uncharacterized protein n=1 Tax=Rhamnella rubrinervis TaxID=2594499 RepID=A0A8K0HDE1_9ROSA|nr:hypothetical protein FNV43_RR06622 [Rhamnella rubrinervis]